MSAMARGPGESGERRRKKSAIEINDPPRLPPCIHMPLNAETAARALDLWPQRSICNFTVPSSSTGMVTSPSPIPSRIFLFGHRRRLRGCLRRREKMAGVRLGLYADVRNHAESRQAPYCSRHPALSRDLAESTRSPGATERPYPSSTFPTIHCLTANALPQSL